MPTVLEFGSGKIKVSIYFKDHNPPHVHVNAPGASAVFAIQTLAIIEASGFTSKALRKIRRALREHQDYLMEVWHEYQA
jgi:hypothetical protein